MALTATTLASAKTSPNDKFIKLTSATGIAVKHLVIVDREIMRVVDVSNSPTIGIVPGYNGSAATPHGILAPVVFGPSSDFIAANGINPQTEVVSQSFGVDGAITGPSLTGVPICDTIVYLTKATAGAYTIALPASDQSNVITFISTTAAAHVVVMTGNPGANDTATFVAAIGSSFSIKAQPGAWGILATGNVTVA
jgi:hypothetical protein